MVVMKICIVFGILLLNALSGFTARIRSKEKGPYRTIAEGVQECNKTVLPYSPKRPVLIKFEVYSDTTNTTFFRGNVTFLRSIRDLELRGMCYLWNKGKWRSHMTLPTLSCKTPLIMTIVSSVTNFKNALNADDCSIRKGNYQFNHANPNWMDHLWTQERAYGRVMWKIELTNKIYTFACLIVTENVVYAK